MTPAPQRIILMPEPTACRSPALEPKVRRYRLARLRVAATHQPADPRFRHLARTFD